MVDQYEIKPPPETLENLKTGMRKVEALDSYLKKVALGGIDVSERQKGVFDMKKRLQSIRDAFFPGEPL